MTPEERIENLRKKKREKEKGDLFGSELDAAFFDRMPPFPEEALEDEKEKPEKEKPSTLADAIKQATTKTKKEKETSSSIPSFLSDKEKEDVASFIKEPPSEFRKILEKDKEEAAFAKKEAAPKSLEEKLAAPKKEETKKQVLPAKEDEKEKQPPGEEEKTPQQLLKALSTDLTSAKTRRDRLQSINSWGELASLIGRSLTQIGAAQAGLKKGIDLSGIGQAALIDWDKKAEQIDRQYEQDVRDVEKQQAKLERQIERTEDREARKELETIKADALVEKERLRLKNQNQKQLNKSLVASAKAALTGDKAELKTAIAQAESLANDTQKQITNITDIRNQLAVGENPKEILAKLKPQIASIVGQEALQKEGTFWGKSDLDAEEVVGVLDAYLEDLKGNSEFYAGQVGSLQKQYNQLIRTVPGQAAAAPATQYKPGDIIQARGKTWRVGADGNSLEEVR